MIDRVAKEKSSEAYQARVRGEVSQLGPESPFEEVKPEYYADARLLAFEVDNTFCGYRGQYGYYGLRDRHGNAVEDFSCNSSRFDSYMKLEDALRYTAQFAFEETPMPVSACPYHPALKNLGELSLSSVDGNEFGLDRVREVTLPGAWLAPATIVNVAKRIPAMMRIHGVTGNVEEIARASRELIREPLNLPQQWAKAFVFSIADGVSGSDLMVDRSSFLPDELIAEYIKPEVTDSGSVRFVWAKPTEDFTLRADVMVADRLQGSETDRDGDHQTVYPAGTRLGDIQVTEPTIGCPGKILAFTMWRRAVEVMEIEGLWQA